MPRVAANTWNFISGASLLNSSEKISVNLPLENPDQERGAQSADAILAILPAMGEESAVGTTVRCGEPMISGTPHAPAAQHKPTLKSHWRTTGHKMSPAQRPAYARSSQSFDGALCKQCQSKEGAVETRE